METLVALAVVQLSVDAPPEEMLDGVAEKEVTVVAAFVDTTCVRLPAAS
jgi:hypothetical protein